MAETQNQPLPGSVVAPGGTPQAPPPPVEPPVQPTVAPPDTPPAAAPAETPAVEAAADSDDGQSIRWTASEFVAHNKSAGWYVLLIIGSLLLAAAVFILTRDKVSTGVVIVAGLLLGVYGSHEPRQLEYVINSQGIGVGGKHHSYDDFRSFAVTSEGAFSSLVFMPLKRFAVPLTIYYAPADEDKILSILSDQLPMEEHRQDAVDSLVKRLRF